MQKVKEMKKKKNKEIQRLVFTILQKLEENRRCVIINFTPYVATTVWVVGTDLEQY